MGSGLVFCLLWLCNRLADIGKRKIQFADDGARAWCALLAGAAQGGKTRDPDVRHRYLPRSANDGGRTVQLEPWRIPPSHLCLLGQASCRIAVGIYRIVRWLCKRPQIPVLK